MRLKNILIVVKDVEKSKKFYHDLFGLETVSDNGGNVILTEGLVLQDEKIWAEFLRKDIVTENNSCELYFEEYNIEAFVKKLERLYPSVKYVNRLMKHEWGQKVCLLYTSSSQVITAPAFISAPVPEAVTMAPIGIPAVGNIPLLYSRFQISSFRTACAETTLQQSMTEPPPTARIKSAWHSRASDEPSCTLV